jgi:uncharacterized protein YeaO (DUF488 family)
MKKARRKAGPKPKGTAPLAVVIKRVYDPPSAADGPRVLVDRLWPRGVAKASLAFDAWPKELAPSRELRNWYRHDPEKFAEFRRRYLTELKERKEELAALHAGLRGRKITLLTATRAIELSPAAVLAEVLAKKA